MENQVVHIFTHPYRSNEDVRMMLISQSGQDVFASHDFFVDKKVNFDFLIVILFILFIFEFRLNRFVQVIYGVNHNNTCNFKKVF